MPSIYKTAKSAAFACFLVSAIAGTVGYGLVQTDTCESGYGLTIDKLDANETVDDTYDRVAFEDLSAAEQRAFLRITTSSETVIFPNQTVVNDLAYTVVTYEGDRYAARDPFVWDCGDPGVPLFFAAIVFGLFGTVSLVVAGTAKLSRRVRR